MTIGVLDDVFIGPTALPHCGNATANQTWIVSRLWKRQRPTCSAALSTMKSPLRAPLLRTSWQGPSAPSDSMQAAGPLLRLNSCSVSRPSTASGWLKP